MCERECVCVLESVCVCVCVCGVFVRESECVCVCASVHRVYIVYVCSNIFSLCTIVYMCMYLWCGVPAF